MCEGYRRRISIEKRRLFPLRFADDSPDSPLEGAGFELLKSPRLHQQIDDLDKVKPRFA